MIKQLKKNPYSIEALTFTEIVKSLSFCPQFIIL